MHVSARSYMTAGVAMFGATAIALTPITPSSPMPDITIPAISTTAVDLTSLENPILLWSQVISQAVANLGGIGQNWLSDPLPILRQILTNQIGNVETVGNAINGVVTNLSAYFTPSNPNGFQALITQITQALAAGRIDEAASIASFGFFTGLILFQIGLPLLSSGLSDIVPNILGNLHSGVATALSAVTLFPVVGSLLNAFQGPLNALGTSGQDILDALSTGNILNAITAVINIPAEVTGAFLNGFTNWDGTPFVGLIQYDNSFPGFYGGFIPSVILGLTRTIAAAIGAPQPVQQNLANVAAGDVPADDSAFISLSTDPVPETGVEGTIVDPGLTPVEGVSTGEVPPAGPPADVPAGPVAPEPTDEGVTEDDLTEEEPTEENPVADPGEGAEGEEAEVEKKSPTSKASDDTRPGQKTRESRVGAKSERDAERSSRDDKGSNDAGDSDSNDDSGDTE